MIEIDNNITNVAMVSANDEWQLISWSAPTEENAAEYAGELTEWLIHNPDASIQQLATVTQTRTKNEKVKKFVVAKDKTELINALKSLKTVPEATEKTLVFLFPGQGSQYAAMGTVLYKSFPVFRDAFEHCRNILLQLTNEDILAVLFETDDTEILHNTRYAQPSIFAVGYALASLWKSLGITPKIILGHSVGEFVAAHIAGIFSLEDGLKLVAERARIVCDTQPGTMVVVRSTREKISELLTDGVAIGAINSTNNLVVAGSVDNIHSFKAILHDNSIPYISLNSSHAFHHPSMDELVPAFREIVATVPLSVPKIPIISSVTGTYLTDAEATDPDYWAGHMSAMVAFHDASVFLAAQESSIILEAGPGKTLFSLIKNTDRRKVGTPTIHPDLPEMKQFLQAVGLLWQHGYTINWDALYTCMSQS